MKNKNSNKGETTVSMSNDMNLSAADFAYAVLHNTSDAITAINLKGEILFWNDGAANLSGYSAEEVLGKNISLVYRKQDIPDLVERINKAKQGEFFTNKELILVDKDKKEHDVLLTLNGLRDESGKITKLVGFTKDITDLKRAERTLEESEERFEQVFNNSPSPISILNLKIGKRLAVNKTFTDVFGYSEEELTGEENIHKVNIAVDQEEYKLAVKKILEDGYIFEFPLKIYTKSGDIRHVLVNGTKAYSNNNDVYLISYLDITERKKSEEAWIRAKETAERSEKFLENILNNIGDPVFVKDDRSRLLNVNDAFCKLFGLTRENILGKTLAEDVSAEEMEAFLKIDKHVLETGEENIIEETLTVRDGETKTIDTRKTRYVDGNGKKHLIGVIRDLTKRKNAELELKRAQEIAHIGNWFLDLTTGEISWSDELYKIYGFDPKLPIPPLSEHEKLLTSESWELLNESIEYTSKTGKPYAIELKTNLKEGDSHWQWFYAKGEAVFDSKNTIIALRGTAQDITEAKIAEEKLEKANAELIDAFSSLNELQQEIEAENIYLKEELKLEGSFNEIVGSSKPLKKILKQVEQVAKTDTSVIILGETGTGKELIARAIHNASDRRDKPMVKVNCSALPAELIESEFFGHEVGAFTSAVSRKIGRFELANGGTIFLDEIGDLPLTLQTRLLRVLQESEFERVGGEKTIKVDVRVITATNRNLEEELINGNFRQDLYYRLNVFPITCPPLRDRIEDVPMLVNHFVNKYNHKVNKKIKTVSQKSIDRLMTYKWPGNIRELEHVIERSVIVNQGGQLRVGSWFSDSDLGNTVPDKLATLEEVERDYITKVLDKVNWKIRGKNGAAEILGLKPTTLESRMKKWDIIR